MLIILEGPNGSGKSTLAAELLAHPDLEGAQLIHKGPPEDGNHLLAEYLLPLAEYRPGSGQHVVCDRWHLGELVYPRLNRRESIATATQFHFLEAFLWSRGAMVVHVDATPATLAKRAVDRGEARTLSERIVHFDRERKLFSLAFVRSELERRWWFMRADPRSAGYRQAVSELVTGAAVMEMQAKVLAPFPTYTGRLRPRALLLGDKRGERYPEYPTAFAPVGGTSGAYLHRALNSPWMKIGHRSMIGIANANEDDPHALWTALGTPPVVALGSEAAKGARAAGLEPGIVPHPQYVRRFHFGRHEDYGRLIEEASRTQEDLTPWPPST